MLNSLASSNSVFLSHATRVSVPRHCILRNQRAVSRHYCPETSLQGVSLLATPSHSPVRTSWLLPIRPVPSLSRYSSPTCYTLKMGCTAGSWRYMAMPKTSDTRCVRRRWVIVWWTWKSLERTQILARSQSYFASEGRKMGFSSPGTWLS